MSITSIESYKASKANELVAEMNAALVESPIMKIQIDETFKILEDAVNTPTKDALGNLIPKMDILDTLYSQYLNTIADSLREFTSDPSNIRNATIGPVVHEYAEKELAKFVESLRAQILKDQ